MPADHHAMAHTRRGFLHLLAAGGTAALSRVAAADRAPARRYPFVQIDVFTTHRLHGNPLIVFPDARGLTDTEMQDLARETNLQETTFVFPRDPAIERKQGIKVRIFIPNAEIPFGGHPTLGTAMVLRNRLPGGAQEIVLDLQVGKIPVAFHTNDQGQAFGEMHQVDPTFGPVHDRATVADLLGLQSADLADWPIQTISTGLNFAIVPIKDLRTLQRLNPDLHKLRTYLDHHGPAYCDFYFVTRDTREPDLGLRARALSLDGEDPATGSAAGCTAAWLVRNGIAKPGQTTRILQGAEIHRPSDLFVRADKTSDKIVNVRVGGNAIEIAEGQVTL
jgi:trans-2,3-dihydro-3-hydroxyanthranilate isomerase